MKQTKIVASISDRRCDTEFIRALFNAGMNVVRMNTAHATEEGIRKIVNNVREVSHHIGILIDTKGPEVRTTRIAGLEDSEQLQFHIVQFLRTLIFLPNLEHLVHF